MSQNLKFSEIQYFRQWWLWTFLIGIFVFTLFLLYNQLILGIPTGDHPMSNLGLCLFAVFVVGFLLLFYFMGLKTEINKEEIQIHFKPFAKKSIPWSEIQKSQLITYGFVGGWGIRLGTKYGTVFNIKGDKGLAIVLNSGERILIGTQKEEELRKFLNDLSI